MVCVGAVLGEIGRWRASCEEQAPGILGCKRCGRGEAESAITHEKEGRACESSTRPFLCHACGVSLPGGNHAIFQAEHVAFLAENVEFQAERASLS